MAGSPCSAPCRLSRSRSPVTGRRSRRGARARCTNAARQRPGREGWRLAWRNCRHTAFSHPKGQGVSEQSQERGVALDHPVKRRFSAERFAGLSDRIARSLPSPVAYRHQTSRSASPNTPRTTRPPRGTRSCPASRWPAADTSAPRSTSTSRCSSANSRRWNPSSSSCARVRPPTTRSRTRSGKHRRADLDDPAGRPRPGQGDHPSGPGAGRQVPGRRGGQRYPGHRGGQPEEGRDRGRDASADHRALAPARRHGGAGRNAVDRRPRGDGPLRRHGWVRAAAAADPRRQPRDLSARRAGGAAGAATASSPSPTARS